MNAAGLTFSHKKKALVILDAELNISLLLL